MESGYLAVKNFERFQHYKDRSPQWIKLYNDLAEDYGFSRLPDHQKAHLVLIWLLASRIDNRIPADARWIAGKIGATEPVDLDALVSAGFLVPHEPTKAKGRREDWHTRHVPQAVRSQVFERDDHKCRECGSADNLEIDHVIPISRGGNGDEENLQVLCRACNRRKRSRTSAEQVATQQRSLEREVEVEKERETDTSVIQLIARDSEEDIDAIILAANRGMQDNPLIGDAYQPIPISHGSRQDVGDWLRDGIPVNVARAACYQRAKEYRPDGRRNRITTMRYFTEAVGDAHDRHRAAQSEAPNVDHRAGPSRETGGSAGAGRKPDKFAHLIDHGDSGTRQAG